MPLKYNLRLAYLFSLLIVLLTALASIAGILFPDFIYPTAEAQHAFLANDVVNLFMKVNDFNKCLLGMHTCDGRCGLHLRWRIISEQFEKMLNDTTIDQIV